MVTRLDYATANVGGPASVAATVGTSWAVGDTALACIVWYGTQTISSVTMAGESNLDILGSPQTGGPDNGRVQWAVLDSVTGTGSKAITANMSAGPTALDIWVWRLSGGGSHGAPVGASGVSDTLSVSVTTSVANAALFGGGASNNWTWTAAAGYTKETGGDYYWYDGVEYDIDAGAIGTYAVDATTAGSGTWVWSAVEIYAAGGGGGPTPMGRSIWMTA